MTVRPLPVFKALEGPVRAQLYHPGDPVRTPQAGLELLRRMALDQPVYSVTLQQGWPLRVLRQVPFDELHLKTRVPGYTAYAAAFQLGNEVHLVVVAPGPLREPPPSLPRPGRH